MWDPGWGAHKVPRRIEITHAPGGSRTIARSTVEQGEAPVGRPGGGAS